MLNKEPVAGYIPELKALKARLNVFVRMRWLVVPGLLRLLYLPDTFLISALSYAGFYHLSFPFGLQSLDVFVEQAVGERRY